MGLLAAAGAVQGLGQGITEVGQQEQKKQMLQKESDIAQAREETLLRLRDTYEKQNLQTQHGWSQQAAGATREFEMGQEQRKFAHEDTNLAITEAGKNKRNTSTVEGRTDVAVIRSGAPGAKGKEGGEWMPRNVNIGQPKNEDGSYNLTAAPVQAAGVFNKRTGKMYNLQGDRAYAWDNDKMQNLREPNSTNRAVQPGEMEDLMRDPTGKIKGGNNDGLYKSDVFEAAHGFLPTAVLHSAVQASQAPSNYTTATGRTVQLGAGSSAPDQPEAPGNPEDQ